MRVVPVFVLSVFVLATARLLGACSQAYVDSTPMQLHEGDGAANYQRVFDTPPPAEVRVLHSVVATYEFRLGVVSSADFEFELLAPEPDGRHRVFLSKR